MQEKLLEGITVLDLSQFLSGPRCTQLLAMKGARVIKIEPPGGESMRILCSVMSAERIMSVMHQNKEGIVLDLKKEEGKDIFRRLAAKADVVVENFAPGIMDSMGLGAGDLLELNPRLVYASISGFGRTGPLSDRLAFDIVAQAAGGIMNAYRAPHCPPKVFFADFVSGAYCALGIMEALFGRERTGKGGTVDISMQDVMYFHYFGAMSERALGADCERVSSLLGRDFNGMLTDESNPLPFWNSYRAKDGYVVVVALTEKQWAGFADALGRPDLRTDPRFSSFPARVRNSAEGTAIVAEWMAARTVAEVTGTLDEARIPCQAVLDEEQVNADHQMAARGMLAMAVHDRLGEVAVPGDPVWIDGAPGEIGTAGPDCGQHTAQVLSELLGMDAASIKELRKKRII